MSAVINLKFLNGFLPFYADNGYMTDGMMNGHNICVDILKNVEYIPENIPQYFIFQK